MITNKTVVCIFHNQNIYKLHIYKIAEKSEGIESKFISTISEKLNFTWSINSPLNGSYGIPLSDGTEDGIVGEVRK